MYQYFYELDKPKDFSVLLLKYNYLEDEYYSIEPSLKGEFWTKNIDLFVNLKKLDNLIETINYKIKENILYSFEDYEKLSIIYDFINKKDEYEDIKNMKNNLQLTSSDLKFILLFYKDCIKGLIEIYPNLSNFLITTEKMIKETLKQLKKKTSIKLPYNNSIEFIFPNSWYITPNGYLYNTGEGHKQGNLLYPYYDILNRLKNNQDVSLVNNHTQIINILKSGYVKNVEFKNYANLIYDIPTVITKDSRLDYLSKRSYQKNIITLVVGHLAAEEALYKSFSRMNSSTCKQQLAQYFSLNNITLDDVLVRYCGFYKISSVVDKTITTSSLNAKEKLKLYLEKGWTIDIIPGIVYDRVKDKVDEVNFNSYFVSEFLNKSLNEYNGKGKILIKDYKNRY